jgi:hypothetical protein
MQTTEIAVKRIDRIGNNNITDEVLYKSIYKSMGWMRRFNKMSKPSSIQEQVIRRELFYHPFWIVKNLVIAERPPFPPRKMPNIIFIDAVSGYRGLFTTIPPMQEEEVEIERLVAPEISEEVLDKYIRNVQHKQINRSYILKKPLHEVKEVSLVYLPIWKVQVKGEIGPETFYINANTGESEKFMSERWKSKKDLLE